MPTYPMIALVSDPRFADHVAPGFHPERPERLDAALRGLDRAVGSGFNRISARPATPDELQRVHDRSYVASLGRALTLGSGYLDGDTFFSPGSHEAAWLAAGGACQLVDESIAGRSTLGLLIARPPGHHATPTRAMGFCLLNNVAIAAAHARAKGLARVAIVDWDVHHGNGTQDAFFRDPSVLYISLHQSPLYPGTGGASDVGEGDGRGSTVNVPLPPGSGPGAYAAAFERLVLPVLEAFRPEMVFVSAGFDAHERDPLASMCLTAEAYGWMAARLREQADRSAQGRMLFALEGGYDLSALEQSVAATIDAARDPTKPPPIEREIELDEADHALRSAVATQRTFWKGALG